MTKELTPFVGEGPRITLNVDIERGRFISPEELERILGIERTNSKYSFELMRMAQTFHYETEAAGDAKAVRGEGYGLRVMTDSEAAQYLGKRFDECIVGSLRVHERHKAVVRADHLTQDERTANDRKLEHESRVLQSMRDANAFHERLMKALDYDKDE